MSTLFYQTTRDTTIRNCLEKPPYNYNHLYTILPETQLYLPAYSNHLTITTTSLPYYQTQLYLPAYSNHLTLTSICLPYCQIHNYAYLPTATTIQKHPPIQHTTRDTNIHLSTIIPETQLYLPAYSNHLTITSICLP